MVLEIAFTTSSFVPVLTLSGLLVRLPHTMMAEAEVVSLEFTPSSWLRQ
jgi:hypothetical protein